MASNNKENPEVNLTQLSKGLNTDYSPQVQPEGTYRFALNAVNEAELGDTMFLSNEEGNEISVNLPTNFIPIGKRYIGDGNTVLFLVNKTETASMIVIFNEEGSVETLVDDTNIDDKLNFKLSHQIDCSYRLRRGNERTLYFTDNFNPPRYYNIDKPDDFKDIDGILQANLFKLFRSYNSIPKFSNIEILEGGSLPPGSYNIAVQYIDKDLNPTEWITTTDTIIVFNDKLASDFETIRGSTNEKTGYQNYGPTNKAIQVTMENLDYDFRGYRLALIEANNGSGNISKISVSDILDIQKSVFLFTGVNTVENITEEEVKAFSTSVEKVAHIEQLENRLLLANVKGKAIDWAKLQHKASLIKSNLTMKEIVLTEIGEDSNPKSPTLHTESVGYMPGEIYSFGIVWVFEDGTTSPAFHIPGRPTVADADNVMSTDNKCAVATYTDFSGASKTYTEANPITSTEEYIANTPVLHKTVNINNVTLTREETTITWSSQVENENSVPLTGTLIDNSYEELGGGLGVDVIVNINLLTPATENTYITFKIKYRDSIDILRVIEGGVWIEEGETSITGGPLHFYEEDFIHGYSSSAELILPGNICKIFMNVSPLTDKTFRFSFKKGVNTVLTKDVVVLGSIGNSYGEAYADLVEYDSYTVTAISTLLPIQKYTVAIQTVQSSDKRLRVISYQGTTKSVDRVVTISKDTLSTFFKVEGVTPTSQTYQIIDAIDSITLSVSVPTANTEVLTSIYNVTDDLGLSVDKTLSISIGSTTSSNITFTVDRSCIVNLVSHSLQPYLYRIKHVAQYALEEIVVATTTIKLNGTTVKVLTNTFSVGITTFYTSYISHLSSGAYTFFLNTDIPVIHTVGDVTNDGTDFWGVDAYGNTLLGSKIRHHRFPLRSEISQPLMYTGNLYDSSTTALRLDLPSIAGLTYTQLLDMFVSGSVTYTPQGSTVAVTKTFAFRVYDVVYNDVRYVDGNDIEVSSRAVCIATNIPFYLIEFSTIAFTNISVTATLNSSTPVTITPSSIACRLIKGKTKKSKIFGINFTNINFPTLAETNGYKIVGYYIVRNDRTEQEKTILDSSVITPVMKETKSGVKYNSTSFLAPELDFTTDYPIKTDILSFINPEFKFNSREYKDFSIIHEGNFTASEKHVSHMLTQDVQAGTTYDPNRNSGGADDDGFDLHTIGRDNVVTYAVTNSSTKIPDISINGISEVYYLNALSYKDTKDSNDDIIPVYNVSSDNKVGIISLGTGIVKDRLKNNFPYVILKSTKLEHYPTFRTLPYYLETDANIPVDDNGDTISTGNSCEVFNGDSYISPMKYENTFFHSLSAAKRPGKQSWWKYLIGGLILIAGVIITIFAPPAGLALVATDLVFLGAAVAFVASGIETDKINKIYNEEYEKGLKYTVEDNITKQYWGTHDKPSPGSDDEIRWFGETISDLWFESSVNMNWRKGNTVGLTDFLDAPSTMSRSTGVYGTSEYKGSQLDTYILDKLTVVDGQQNNGRLYKGYAGAELYEINKDYQRRNREKLFFALGINYNTRGTRGEEFPTRVMYSEQSFQEELTDNYRIFLPNNYRDIDGETGAITNMFKIQNSLFLHTREALWNLPKSYQERVTNQIVSFLGTGSYFEIPPQKLVDDDTGNSAGTSHKWGSIKTPHGYFFPCEKQNCFYQFNGKSLQNISDKGLQNELYYKIPFQINKDLLPGLEYNNSDNPSNPIGVGYISTYDSKKERIIFTKKDFTLESMIVETGDFYAFMANGICNYFIDYYKTIKARETGNDTYLGIFKNETTGNMEMRFEKSDPVVASTYGYPYLLPASWTLSYSLKTQSWVSWHSYLPSFYIHTSQNFFSFRDGNYALWKHNTFGKYQKFYNHVYPFIIEYVSLGNPMYSKTWENLQIVSEAKKYVEGKGDFVDTKAFFSNAILYNSRQCSGYVNINIKDNSDSDYISTQTDNANVSDIIADRNERNWTLNNLRDFRVNYDEPIFKTKTSALEIFDNYFIDKAVNDSTIDFNKDWTEIENFRDKYLAIRLIFDTFANPSADIKLLVNYSIENEKQSFR